MEHRIRKELYDGLQQLAQHLARLALTDGEHAAQVHAAIHDAHTIRSRLYNVRKLAL